jgi:thioredoxin reductase (NADPH)
MENVIILGSGCAGLTAALYAARASLKPLVLDGSMPGGLLTTTSTVENFPGFPGGIDGYELTANIRKQSEKFGARTEGDVINRVDFSGEVKKLFGESGKVYETRAVIVATGASPKMLGVKGEKEFYAKGVHTCATCDGAFYRGKEVAVLGGGDSACEEAHFLTHFATKVTIVHRREALRASKVMVSRVLNHPKIFFAWNSGVEEILGSHNENEKGKVGAIRLKNLISGEVSELKTDGVFLAIGHAPQTGFLKGALPTNEAGYLETVSPSIVRTSIPGVYAAGDCADHLYRQAITAAGMGCMAAIEAERFLAK